MYRCPSCGKVFEGVGQLRAHFKRRHAKLSACPVCGGRFLSLEIHLAKMACKDERHAAYYFLCMSDRKRDNSETRRQAYKAAMEAFKVEA